MKICGRCDQPIQDDEEYTEYPVPAPTGPGATVYWHAEKCKPVPTQTAPAGRW